MEKTMISDFETKFTIPYQFGYYETGVDSEDFVVKWYDNIENYTLEQINMFADVASFQQKDVRYVYNHDKFLLEFYKENNPCLIDFNLISENEKNN
jgi:hypothetical protein